MIQVLQYSERLFHDQMRSIALNIHYKTNPTAIMLKGGIVQTLFRRNVGFCHIHALPDLQHTVEPIKQTDAALFILASVIVSSYGCQKFPAPVHKPVTFTVKE